MVLYTVRNDPRSARPLLLALFGLALFGLALILFALAAVGAVKSVKVDDPKVVLKRGSYNIATFDTMAACESALSALYEKDGLTKESGYGVYKCLHDQATRVAFGPNPVATAPTCTTPKPTQTAQVMQCPAGSVGTWSQTRDYVPAPYPACWTAAQWTPAEAPAGICATAQLRVYTCADPGADGRILEGNGITWPNCAKVSYQPPSRDLVVAVNPGVHPLMWRLASRLTDERIWTQTGGVGDWVRLANIDWGTTPVPQLGSVTFSWTPSTENCEDSPDTDLAKYRILYGTSATALTRTIDVPATVNKHVIDQLSPGTWFFAVKALNSAGADCGLSPIASKTLP